MTRLWALVSGLGPMKCRAHKCQCEVALAMACTHALCLPCDIFCCVHGDLWALHLDTKFCVT
jgi:hypothetical protein